MIEGQTPNTVELSNLLPLDTERQDMREQWLKRLLKSPALRCETVMSPFAQAALKQAGKNGQVILLSMDQTDLGDRMAVLMITVRVGDRSLPLAWLAEEGAANIGFAKQKMLLDCVLRWDSRRCESHAVSRSILSIDQPISMVKRPELALPLAPERQSAGRSWRW
jgi:hypothetical protein